MSEADILNAVLSNASATIKRLEAWPTATAHDHAAAAAVADRTLRELAVHMGLPAVRSSAFASAFAAQMQQVMAIAATRARIAAGKAPSDPRGGPDGCPVNYHNKQPALAQAADVADEDYDAVPGGGDGAGETQRQAVRRTLYTSFELPLSQLRTARNSGIALSGILLYGPPGSGKTVALQMMARSIDGLGLYELRQSDLISKWAGQTQKCIRKAFSAAVSNNHRAAIVFFDEMDAVGGSRSGGNGEHSDDAVVELLKAIDRLGDQQGRTPVVVVGATNFPGAIDSALMSRMSRAVYLGLPLAAERVSMCAKSLTTKARHAGCELAASDVVAWAHMLAHRVPGLSAREITAMAVDAVDSASMRVLMAELGAGRGAPASITPAQLTEAMNTPGHLDTVRARHPAGATPEGLFPMLTFAHRHGDNVAVRHILDSIEEFAPDPAILNHARNVAATGSG